MKERFEMNKNLSTITGTVCGEAVSNSAHYFILFSEGRYIPCVINNSALTHHFTSGDVLEVSVKKINRSYLDLDFTEKEIAVYEVLDYQSVTAFNKVTTPTTRADYMTS